MVHYLDNAASTAIRPEALETMMSLLQGSFGNPSGAHKMARDANRVLDDAREQLADLLGVKPGEIVFTGGGTESDNLAIRGVAQHTGKKPACSTIEHHAVLYPVEALAGEKIAVHPSGLLDLDALGEVLEQDVSVVSVMASNNETGVIQPMSQVHEVVKSYSEEISVHTDAVQAFSWLNVELFVPYADLISLSAHKFGGPKGVGALVVKNPQKLSPQLLGGSQERERRAGTQNVPGIAAMVAAAIATAAEREEACKRVAALRDRLADTLLDVVADTVESGDRLHKTANICHLCFDGVESEALLFLLEKEQIMASAASSCSSGAMEPSHVLAAMGYSYSLGLGSLRLSLGYDTTEEDIDAVLQVLPAAVNRIRECG